MLFVSVSDGGECPYLTRLDLAVELLSTAFVCAATTNLLYSSNGPHVSCEWLFNRQKYQLFLIVPASFALDSKSGLSRNHNFLWFS